MATQKLLSRLLPVDQWPCGGRGGQCSNAGVVEVQVAYVVSGRPALRTRKLCTRCTVLWLARRIEDEGLLAVPGDVLAEIGRVLPMPDVSFGCAPPTEQMLVEGCGWERSTMPPGEARVHKKPKKGSKDNGRSR